MKIEKFEDILAWQKSKELTLHIYRLYKDNKDYGLRDQIQRSAVSIMNNIAEGFERNSNRELVRFLYIAKASCAELRSMLYLSIELQHISESEFETTYDLSVQISKMLSGFIKTL